MSTLPPKWDALFRDLNRLPGNMGAPGVRDPDSVCEAFDGDGYDGIGDCLSDGHYLCTECSQLSPDAYRFTEYGAQGRLDRLRARAATFARRVTAIEVFGSRSIYANVFASIYDPRDLESTKNMAAARASFAIERLYKIAFP